MATRLEAAEMPLSILRAAYRQVGRLQLGRGSIVVILGRRTHARGGVRRAAEVPGKVF
jgi:hypothetical protein